jgi:hypothetical protein
MSIQQAEHWLKTVVSGQPLHRDELGVEDSSGGTLRGISPTTLQLAPQLKQELSQELAAAPTVDLGPRMSTPGMSPGGNMTQGPSGMRNRSPKPPTNNDGE